MQRFDTLFEHELRKVIDKSIENLRDQLETNTYEDVGQFKYVMGKIAAMRFVADTLIEEAKDATEQRNR